MLLVACFVRSAKAAIKSPVDQCASTETLTAATTVPPPSASTVKCATERTYARTAASQEMKRPTRTKKAPKIQPKNKHPSVFTAASS